jgi:glutathione peroxidase
MVYDIAVTTIDGRSHLMDVFRGKTLLVVNVASRCGFTPQYAGLERLYRRYRDQGLVVLGFPCDQFGHQEPGTEAEIRQFCDEMFYVSFPLFAKINVNGPDAHPLYRLLKEERKGVLGSSAIKWNFTKLLIGPTGEVLARYGSRTTPERIEADVVRALAAPA